MSPSSLVSLLVQSAVEDGWIGSWSPGIGDPTFVGWFTVLAYLVAAFLCFRVYRRLPPSKYRGIEGVIAALTPLLLALTGRRRLLSQVPERVRMAALWLGLAIALLFLGINKQLDLQTVPTEIGRMMARAEGWYAVRRIVQVIFIAGVVLTGIWIFRAVLQLARGSRGRVRPVLAGTVFILCFVAIRASSFHHIDILLGMRFSGAKLNWIIELGGIAFVAYGAYREGHRLSAPLAPR